MPAGAAVDRAAELLALSERLQVAVLTAVADVDTRELFAEDAAGSSRSWLRQQSTGDRGQLNLSRKLRRYDVVRGAVADGGAGLSVADVVMSELDRLPGSVPEHQIRGVLENALPDLLEGAHGGTFTRGARTVDQQRVEAELRSIVDEALQATAAAPAARLEPAFVLLARVLTPRQVAADLPLLVDALQPERVADREKRAHDSRSWRLVKHRFTSGFRLEVELTDEDGLALQADVEARVAAADVAATTLARHQAAQVSADEPESSDLAADPAAADPPGAGQPAGDPPGGTDEPDLGQMGPGRPPEEPPASLWGTSPPRGAPPPTVDHGGPPTKQLQRYQAFMSMVRDAAAARGRGSPPPFGYLITVSIEALEARAGVLPGTLTGPDGRVSLTPEAVRRLGCDGPLSAVLLDAARNPVGASSTRRHATERERRAIRARQGVLCGVNGCANPWTIPHHVEPWWKTRITRLKDLLGVCEHCHHDVHDGHRTLLLRDGRLIDENGWVQRATAP